MLVFFIHGVATRDVQYAERLKALIREEYTERNKSLPHFYSSFWGNVLRDIENAHLITDNIFKETPEPSLNTLVDIVRRLSRIPGMTNDTGNNSKVAIVHLRFKDGSGTLRLFVNPLQVHHVYIFNSNEDCQFGGYVGWMHTEGLKQEIEFIKRNFC